MRISELLTILAKCTFSKFAYDLKEDAFVFCRGTAPGVELSNRVFQKYTKLAMLTFFYCSHFENKLGLDNNGYHSHLFDFLAPHQMQISIKFIHFITNSNLVPLEDIQKCQHCQHYVLPENPNVVEKAGGPTVSSPYVNKKDTLFRIFTVCQALSSISRRAQCPVALKLVSSSSVIQ